MSRLAVVLFPLSLVTVAGIAACASAGQGTAESTAAASSTSPSADVRTLGPGLLQWTGRFQQIQQQTGDGTAVRGRNRVSGTVKLTSTAAGRMTANLAISTPLTTAANVRWALVSGSCGSGAIPVLPVDQFPEINVSGSGHGDLDADVPTPLPTTGTYHVNVYWTTGKDEGDVMTCANLRLEPRKRDSQ